MDKSWFKLDPKTGVLTLLKSLNRDAPDGMPIYYLPVSVTDNGQNSSYNLITYSTVKIILNDINDNAPVLVYGSNVPLIINEGDNAGSVEIYVVDVDLNRNGPPFTFVLQNYTDVFGLQMINCNVNCQDREKYQLFNKQVLNRDVQSVYMIAYTVSDNGGLSRSGVIQIIVGDVDNNPQSDGSKQVKITSYENNIAANLFLGTLYVKDLDDWDQVYKQESNCIANPNVFK